MQNAIVEARRRLVAGQSALPMPSGGSSSTQNIASQSASTSDDATTLQDAFYDVTNKDARSLRQRLCDDQDEPDAALEINGTVDPVYRQQMEEDEAFDQEVENAINHESQ